MVCDLGRAPAAKLLHHPFAPWLTNQELWNPGSSHSILLFTACEPTSLHIWTFSTTIHGWSWSQGAGCGGIWWWLEIAWNSQDVWLSHTGIYRDSPTVVDEKLAEQGWHSCYSCHQYWRVSWIGWGGPARETRDCPIHIVYSFFAPGPCS